MLAHQQACSPSRQLPCQGPRWTRWPWPPRVRGPAVPCCSAPSRRGCGFASSRARGVLESRSLCRAAIVGSAVKKQNWKNYGLSAGLPHLALARPPAVLPPRRVLCGPGLIVTPGCSLVWSDRREPVAGAGLSHRICTPARALLADLDPKPAPVRGTARGTTVGTHLAGPRLPWLRAGAPQRLRGTAVWPWEAAVAASLPLATTRMAEKA